MRVTTTTTDRLTYLLLGVMLAASRVGAAARFGHDLVQIFADRQRLGDDGVAHLEREPHTPKAELLMAIVGPLTSLLIGAAATTAGVLLAGTAALVMLLTVAIHRRWPWAHAIALPRR